MPSVLITGANRGLGLEFTKQYAESGYRVFACARDPAGAEELTKLAARHASVSTHALEVGSAESVAALARTLASEPIDVLLNNAGVMGPERQHVGDIDFEAMVDTFRVNTVGPLRLADAFTEHVARSERKLMVAITSGMGSISDSSGGYYAYRASKAALNMTFRNLALDLKKRGIAAVVINPGWVQTDMGGARAPLPVDQSIRAMRKVLDGVTLAESGRFLNYDGGGFAW